MNEEIIIGEGHMPIEEQNKFYTFLFEKKYDLSTMILILLIGLWIGIRIW